MPLHSQDSGLDFPVSDEDKPNQMHSDASHVTRQATHGDKPGDKQGGALKPARKQSSGARTKQPGITSRASKRTNESTDKELQETNIEAAQGDAQTPRRTVLLSCTHVFHRVCLEAFEELALAQTKVCPVCRAGYQKRTL